MLVEGKDHILVIVTSSFLHHSLHFLVDRQMLVAFVLTHRWNSVESRTCSVLHSVSVTLTGCLINTLMTAWDGRRDRDKLAHTPPLNFTSGKLQLHNHLICILVFLCAGNNVIF